MEENKNKISIMEPDARWSTKRFEGSHMHHIFGGANRKLSDEDGLFIFLTPQAHNMSNNGIHFNREFDLYAKKKAQKTWMEYYGKTKEDFIRRYGKNYLDIL